MPGCRTYRAQPAGARAAAGPSTHRAARPGRGTPPVASPRLLNQHVIMRRPRAPDAAPTVQPKHADAEARQRRQPPPNDAHHRCGGCWFCRVPQAAGAVWALAIVHAGLRRACRLCLGRCSARGCGKDRPAQVMHAMIDGARGIALPRDAATAPQFRRCGPGTGETRVAGPSVEGAVDAGRGPPRGTDGPCWRAVHPRWLARPNSQPPAAPLALRSEIASHQSRPRTPARRARGGRPPTGDVSTVRGPASRLGWRPARHYSTQPDRAAPRDQACALAGCFRQVDWCAAGKHAAPGPACSTTKSTRIMPGRQLFPVAPPPPPIATAARPTAHSPQPTAHSPQPGRRLPPARRRRRLHGAEGHASHVSGLATQVLRDSASGRCSGRRQQGSVEHLFHNTHYYVSQGLFFPGACQRPIHTSSSERPHIRSCRQSSAVSWPRLSGSCCRPLHPPRFRLRSANSWPRL
jgi:hypothetical protein